MALPTFGSPVQFITDILAAAFPSAKVTSEELEFSQFTSVRPGKQFIVVQDAGGGETTSHLLQDNPRIEIQSYTYGSKRDGQLFAYEVQRALYLASFDQTTTDDGHMRRIRTPVRPYRQNLQGIPSQVVRYSATYSFGFRSR